MIALSYHLLANHTLTPNPTQFSRGLSDSFPIKNKHKLKTKRLVKAPRYIQKVIQRHALIKEEARFLKILLNNKSNQKFKWMQI